MAVLQNPPSSFPPEPPMRPGIMKCEACGKEMAKSARTCPHCGKSYTTFGGVFWAILLGLLLGGFFFVKNR